MRILILLLMLCGSAYGQTIPYQFFGPVQSQGALTEGAGPQDWHFPGSALSPSCQTFNFNIPGPPVKWAVWKLFWVGNNIYNKFRLIYADDGPTNIVEIAVIASQGYMTPVNQGIDVTAFIENLRIGAMKKQICIQVQGVTTYTLYDSRLEVVY